MTRVIHFSIKNEDFFNIVASTDSRKLQEAIGYLCTWGLHYPHVTIHRVEGTELIAHYYKAEKAQHPSYTIGAVWHNGTYTFHS